MFSEHQKPARMKCEAVLNGPGIVHTQGKNIDNELVNIVIAEQELLKKTCIGDDFSAPAKSFFEVKRTTKKDLNSRAKGSFTFKGASISTALPETQPDHGKTNEVKKKEIRSTNGTNGSKQIEVTTTKSCPKRSAPAPVSKPDTTDEIVRAAIERAKRTKLSTGVPPPCVLRNRKRQCRFPGCVRTIKSQGHCQRHGALAKRCKVNGCEKQAQGTHEGMCKRHWKEAHNIPDISPTKVTIPVIPEGDSIYDSILPASLIWKGTKKKVEDREMMPFVTYLKSNSHLEAGWHRNKERKSRGLPKPSSMSAQLDAWERQLVLLEIALLAGTLGHGCNQDLAHAWGREKGFHVVLCHQVCERRGEMMRKKRSDTGKSLTPEKKESFRVKLHEARNKTREKNKTFLQNRQKAIDFAKKQPALSLGQQNDAKDLTIPNNTILPSSSNNFKPTVHNNLNPINPITNAIFVLQAHNAANNNFQKGPGAITEQENVERQSQEMTNETINPPVHLEQADIEEMVQNNTKGPGSESNATFKDDDSADEDDGKEGNLCMMDNIVTAADTKSSHHGDVTRVY